MTVKFVFGAWMLKRSKSIIVSVVLLDKFALFRIRDGTVFIVAEYMSGTLQELCKNLALSGLGSIQVICLTENVILPLLYVIQIHRLNYSH